MYIPVAATSLDSQKRPRDVDDSNISDESADQTPSVKRICRPHFEDSNIFSILEKVSEANGSYALNELDEAQEERVYVFMKSLEKEIGVSDSASSFILFPEGQVVDSTPLQTVSQENCIAEDFPFCVADATSSTTCAGELESFGLPSLLKSIYSLNERSSCTLMEVGALVAGSIRGPAEDERPALVQSEKLNRFDIGHLLEASDDELGISEPRPTSGNFSSEDDFISGKLVTDSTSSNINDKFDFEPWQFEWDCSSENFYELAHDDQCTDEEYWLRSVVSTHGYGR